MEDEKHLPRNSFLFYRDWRDGLANLPTELKAEVYDSIVDYALDGEHADLSPQAQMIFAMILPKLIRDYNKYANVVKRNRENGIKGGRPRKTEETQENPKNPVGYLETQKSDPNPKNLDNDNENENDNGNDKLNNSYLIDNNILSPEIIIEDPYSFEIFWELYDKKVDKQLAQRKYSKLTLAEKKLIFEFVPKYKAAQPDKRYRKDPCTFLNRRAWENEIIEDGPSRNNNQQRAIDQATDLQRKLFDQL